MTFGLAIGGRWKSAEAAIFTSGSVNATADQQVGSTNFSTLPEVTPVVTTSGTDTSSTTPDATGLVFKGSFSQTLTAPSSSSYGSFNVAFTADSGDTYSLFGSAASTAGYGSISVSLYDNSSETSVYDYAANFQGDGSAIADGSGGPTFGTLAAGNYEFSISTSLSAPSLVSFAKGSLAQPDAVVALATLTGSGGITLVPAVLTPEPCASALLLIGIGGVLLLGRRHSVARLGVGLALPRWQ